MWNASNLPPALGSTLHRVAQESITNTQRHARGATRVEIALTGSPADVRLTVEDDGARAGTPGPPGYRLAGMNGRAALIGGTFSPGPGPDRGWVGRVLLPRRGAGT